MQLILSGKLFQWFFLKAGVFLTGDEYSDSIIGRIRFFQEFVQAPIYLFLLSKVRQAPLSNSKSVKVTTKVIDF